MTKTVNRNPKFLVIDDAPNSRRLVKTFLKQMGYNQVVEAENGAEALEKLSTEGVEFIISDLTMDDISCSELYKQIRAEDHLKDIPFLALTPTRDGAHELSQAKAVGIKDYVSEPLDLATLSSGPWSFQPPQSPSHEGAD